VHLAVVDPGVGSGRRILAVRLPRPISWRPTNGLLTPVLDDAVAIQLLERQRPFLAGPGQTFHGRDRFAPVAAWLLNGGGESGPLDPRIDDSRRLPAPHRRAAKTGRITGRIVHVDRYGNLVTDHPGGAGLPPVPCRAEVAGNEQAGILQSLPVGHYAEFRRARLPS